MSTFLKLVKKCLARCLAAYMVVGGGNENRVRGKNCPMSEAPNIVDVTVKTVLGSGQEKCTPSLVWLLEAQVTRIRLRYLLETKLYSRLTVNLLNHARPNNRAPSKPEGDVASIVWWMVRGSSILLGRVSNFPSIPAPLPSSPVPAWVEHGAKRPPSPQTLPLPLRFAHRPWIEPSPDAPKSPPSPPRPWSGTRRVTHPPPKQPPSTFCQPPPLSA